MTLQELQAQVRRFRVDHHPVRARPDPEIFGAMVSFGPTRAGLYGALALSARDLHDMEPAVLVRELRRLAREAKGEFIGWVP